MTINNDTATADSNRPTLNSKNTVVGNTSVLNRVAPENTKIGPNSPSDRAHASVAAVNMPRRASGNATNQNAFAHEHPSVIATCSPRGEICSNVPRIVRTENAHATENCARITLGIAYVIGIISSIQRPTDV